MNLVELLKEVKSKGIVLYLDQGKLAFKAPTGAMNKTIKSNIVALKSEIVELLHKSHMAHGSQIDAHKRQPGDTVATSFSQQRLWILDKIDGGSSHYNVPAVLRLSGDLNLDAVQKALLAIVGRHESLRTCFTEGSDGLPLQVIRDTEGFAATVTDLSTLDDEAQQRELNRCIEDEAAALFDLATDFMLRAQVLTLADAEHVVLVTMHHIASDGWSMGILIKEFSTLYSANVEGQNSPLAPLPIQYADYAQWQRDWLQDEVLDKQLSYWTEKLADLPVVHSLPLDHIRPEQQTFAGQTHPSHISLDISARLNSLCQDNGATLYMGLHAAFSALLARYSNETDIVVGSPIANREQSEVAPLIGFFTNTLVLRSDLSANPGFRALLKQSQQTLLDAYAHQQVPFEQIVEKLQPERHVAHSPLFQIILVLHNHEQGSLELPGLTLSPVEQDGCVAKYDIMLNVTETSQGLSLAWGYNVDLFSASTIAQMAVHFERLMDGLLAAPDEGVAQIPMLTEAESTQQVKQFNDTAVDYPQQQYPKEQYQQECLHQWFEAVVANNPDAVAAVFEQTSISYTLLNQKANRLALCLIESGVEIGARVGIYLDRGIEMLIAVLAVMKSGGTYVPLEPDYPTARVKMILEDAEVEMVLLDSGSMQTLPMEGIDVLLMDNAATDDQWMSEFPGANIGDSLGDDQPELTPDNLLYILFTSGSTGRPKGVMVPQRGLINYLHHSTSQYLSAAMQGSVVSSPLCFDATLTTLLTPLFGGKTVHLVADNDNTLSLLATQLFDQTQPWLFKITPAHLEALALLAEPGKVCEAGHKIVVGGEQLSYKTLEVYRQQLLPNATFINEYGPTETVVGCSVYTVAPLSEAPEAANRPLSVPIFVPIGRAIGNTRLYVMSQGMQVQPINSIGELYIGGDGVTMGYLNRDDLTEQSYLEHPHIAGERLYRTGDLVRWLADGQLAFVGRVDHQVKIRGFRIELGEIESVLRDHDDVRDAVVVANTDEQDTRLVAYVVPNQYPVNVDDQALKQDEKALAQDKQALGRTYLECAQAMLPQYMVPSLYVVLESLPLTNNGKVDTAALPAPGGEGIQQQEYVAPVTPTECVVCELWQEMLQIEQVGVSDNFFELGGHSLTATRLIAQINQQFGLMLSLQVIFKMQTVAELVVHIDFLVAQNDINRASESGSDDSELEEVEW